MGEHKWTNDMMDAALEVHRFTETHVRFGVGDSVIWGYERLTSTQREGPWSSAPMVRCQARIHA